MRFDRIYRVSLGGIALAILLMSVSVAHGANKYWALVGGTTDWNLDSSWLQNGSTPTTVPTSSDNAYVCGYTAGGSTAKVDSVDTFSTGNVGYWYNGTGARNEGAGTLWVVTNGSITSAGLFNVGNAHGSFYSGTIYQDDGVVRPGRNLYIYSDSSYTLNGGLLSVLTPSWDYENIGSNTTGTSGTTTFTQIGGTNTTTTEYIGNGAPVSGLNGSCTGIYNQSGGLNSVTNLNVGTYMATSGGTSTGIYTLSGSGTNTVGTLNLGTSSSGSGSGTYNLNGGTLTVGAGGFVGGSVGTSTFNFNGGTLKPSTASTTFMQGLTNAYVKSGGAIIDTAGFDVTIAQALVDGGGGGGLTKNDNGTLTLTGANTYTGLTTVNGGTLAYGADNVIPGAVAVAGGEFALGTHSGTVTGVSLTGGLISSSSSGTLTSTSDYDVRSGSITANLAGSVGLTKTTSGTVVLGSLSGYTPSGSLNYTGLTTINGGTLEAIGAGGLGLLASAGLNIEHGAAVLDYTGLTDPISLDPVANTLMQQAHANGWVIDPTHPVGSTTAATDPLVHALGWTDTVVDGRTVLTVMYTLCGDADLSGTVNGSDLNVVLSNYNKTGMYWSQGDFNYDGTVNGADLNMVLSNYNQSVSVGAAVPEPSSLLLAVAGLAGLVAYAWRKRR